MGCLESKEVKIAITKLNTDIIKKLNDMERQNAELRTRVAQLESRQPPKELMQSCCEKIEESTTQKTEIAKELTSIRSRVSELRQELQEKTTRVPSYIEDSASLYLKQDPTPKSPSKIVHSREADREERKSELREKGRGKKVQKDESPFRVEVKGSCNSVANREFIEQRNQAQPQVQPNQIPLNQGYEEIQEQGNEKGMEEGNIDSESKSSNGSRELHMNQYNNLLKGMNSARVA
eukprot:TRINITY_DN1710_c0_g3_i6.p1 TRINITY_DN1710_c0_g3~~TRINITY_DN1710_c0_g3_i6.p1  ORF type:complete len:235 (-),score=63.19 TRINITY_DN1710_c0_g3_i6:759-1463(-)